MSQAKIQFELGGLKFSGEGSETWVAQQVDLLFKKVAEFKSTGLLQPPSVQQSPVGAGASPAAQPVKPAPSSNVAPKPASKPKSAKKGKSVMALDKSLNLSPSGKQSAADFANEKAPANVKQKCVVAVYYLREVVELSPITASSVYTFFKELSWPVPSDLKNTLQQAGTEGWLDTADSEDIKLTHGGENLVEHKLPPKNA
jgi:hypothetical protein